ncbi:hypothetical protein [Burkholderia latens]|uniref:Uncharacterized protein n=1 Tax=Burkholderia latens TaxID=488446 RepID=A0A6P2LAT3_9BURK|nr:hypothetical protein [Burkholderia latens]VWB65629.1 hypothetical protein BLA24064_03051 [Burkholderia latens]
MKRRHAIRFASTSSAPGRAGLVRAPRTHADITAAARAARALIAWMPLVAVARRSCSLQFTMPRAVAPPAISLMLAVTVTAMFADAPLPAALAATLACATAVRGGPAVAHRRNAQFRPPLSMPASARRPPFLLFALP